MRIQGVGLEAWWTRGVAEFSRLVTSTRGGGVGWWFKAMWARGMDEFLRLLTSTEGCVCVRRGSFRFVWGSPYVGKCDRTTQNPIVRSHISPEKL